MGPPSGSSIYFQNRCNTRTAPLSAISRSRSSGAARHPVVLKAAVEVTATKSEDGISAANGPEHTGALEALTDDGFASGFHDAGANKQVLLTKLGIVHPKNGSSVLSLEQKSS